MLVLALWSFVRLRGKSAAAVGLALGWDMNLIGLMILAILNLRADVWWPRRMVSPWPKRIISSHLDNSRPHPGPDRLDGPGHHPHQTKTRSFNR